MSINQVYLVLSHSLSFKGITLELHFPQLSDPKIIITIIKITLLLKC